jgi:hypothetical protein
MKNLIKISVLALAATALMVSCAKETNFEEQPASKVVRTFTCTFAQPDTKVAITDAGKTTWEVGDQILVHGAGSSNKVTVTLTAADISADGKKATITVEGVTPYDRSDKGYTSTLYAQYPASLAGSDDFYYEARFSSTNAPLMAAANVDDTFVFYNLCGIISFSVTGDFDKYVFVGNNGEGVGYTPYQARVWAESDGPHVEYLKSGNGATPVAVMSVEGTLNASGNTLVCLPVGTTFSGGFTFKFYKNDALVKLATTTTAVEVKHGQILALGDITSKLEDYVAPSTSDHTPADWAAGAVDLSNGGAKAANCYILSAAGTYKFPALKGSTAEKAGNVFDVQLVWETENGEDAVEANSIIAAVDFDNDNIYFKTPETLKHGNALIAAKNAEGNIFWNWHIWIPSTAIEDFNAPAFYDKPVMDRNLGAMVKATTTDATMKTYGLYYQWGRTAPMMPAAMASAGTALTVVDGPKPLSFAIQNPAVFIKVGESDSAGNWCEADLPYLWANAEGEKAEYDPCPAGYQLPAYNEALAMFAKNNDGWSYTWDSNYYAYGDYVFPISGWLNGSTSIAYAGSRAIITSNKAHSTPRASLKIVRQDKSGYYYNNYFKQEATPVRCVSIAAAAPEPTPVSITIDGDMSDWDNVTAVVNGCHTFKYASDETNLYFYSLRGTSGRYSDIWGGNGYIYLAFDLDGDATNGVTLNSNGPYDFIGFFLPYGGSADAPAIIANAGNGGDSLPAPYTLANIVCKGVVNESGAAIEYSVPRADLPAIPNTEITITTWGNKDLSKVTTTATL